MTHVNDRNFWTPASMDAGLLVPEHRDRALPGGRQVGEPDCLIGELDADNARSC